MTETPVPIPKSTEMAMRGIHTDADCAAVFTQLVGDTLSGAVDRHRTNAACNSIRQVLRMIELKHKYGSAGEPIKLIEHAPASPPTRESVLAKLTKEEREALG